MNLTQSLFDEGPPPPCPPRFNLARHSVMGPAPDSKVALTIAREGGTEEWTYGEIRAAVLRIAGGLRARGIGPGDRVALRVGHELAFPLFFFGTIAAGAVAAPVSPMLTEAELALLLSDCEPTLLIDPRAAAEAICPVLTGTEFDDAAPADWADTGAEDPAFLIYTSGTGGRPKGVLHAQRAGWARRMMWDGWYGLGPEDRVLHAGAFNWTYTLGAGLMDPWAAGASTIIWTGPRDPAVWARLAKAHKATIFAAAPGVYRQLLNSDADMADFAAIRHGLTAGEKTPEALRDRWTEATGKPLYEALGMSEVSTYISSSPTTPVRPGYAGRPQQGRRVAVLDEAGAPAPIGQTGRLAVSRRDPAMMLGYWRRETPWQGEWFLTGDLAEMNADGYVAHRGRADDVMNALGYRVDPGEVEAALASCPGVAEAAAAALPVRADLEIIAAFVVPGPGVPHDPAPILAHCAARLARYKQPREVVFVEALPRTANGKLRRKELISQHRRDGVREET
jgi:acyl-coenzyme A synthetase/AMP-(fatty) acid ligase